VIVDEFAEGADDMLHGWSTDIVEGFNKFFTKFLPKDRTFGMSIENKVRIHLAICIDSAGYVETYRRLSDKIGVNLGKVHEEMNRILDVRKLYLRKYRKRLVVRTKKKLKFFEKLRTQATKMVKENRKNLQYGSGISGPFAEDSQTTPTRTPTKAQTTENSRVGTNDKTEYQCRHCSLWGHRRTSAKACLKNKNKNNARSVEICDKAGPVEGTCGVGVVWCQFLLRM
jgi:hypothetical protein